MRWRRPMLATVAGLGLTGLVVASAGDPVVGLVQEPVAAILPASASDWIFAKLVDVVAVMTVALPGVLLAVAICMIGKPPGDGFTRCGQCGYILKGLTVPRCPECGEGI